MPIGNPPSIEFSRRENSPLYFNICTYFSPLAYVFKRFSKIKFVKKNIRRSIFKAKIVGTWKVQKLFFYSWTRVDFPWTLALVHRAKRLQVMYFLSHTCQSAYLFLGNNKI